MINYSCPQCGMSISNIELLFDKLQELNNIKFVFNAIMCTPLYGGKINYEHKFVFDIFGHKIPPVYIFYNKIDAYFFAPSVGFINKFLNENIEYHSDNFHDVFNFTVDLILLASNNPIALKLFN